MTKFNKGDKVRLHANDIEREVVVPEIPDSLYLVVKSKDSTGKARFDLFTEDMIEAVPSFPERWFNVWADSTSVGYRRRGAADAAVCGVPNDRIGVLHLHPDGTTTMEAP